MNNSMQQMQMQQIQNINDQTMVLQNQMLAVYEYLHGKQIEKAGDVKAKQTLFLG